MGQNSSKDKDDIPANRIPHKHRSNITWSGCHQFESECHICGVYIDDYEKYCTHLKEEHYDVDDNLEWLTCDVCGKCNAHKSNFISHLASHTGRKPFKCRIVLSSGEYCVTEASTRQNLQTHIQKVHKISVKHSLQTKTRKVSPSVASSKKRKKKKKKRKKRKYEEVDMIPDGYNVNDDLYGYSYKPRKSKRRRKHHKLSVNAQQASPYCHPLEILIAAATYVEMNNLSIKNKSEAAKNWSRFLNSDTMQSLQQAADYIDDISTTQQIE